jgi:hypothetical protein
MKKLIFLLTVIILLFTLVGCPTPENGDDGSNGKNGETKTVIEEKVLSLTTKTIYDGLCQKDWQEIVNPAVNRQIIILEIYNQSKCHICFYYSQNDVVKNVCVKDKEIITLLVNPEDLLKWKSTNTTKEIKIDISYYE